MARRIHVFGIRSTREKLGISDSSSLTLGVINKSRRDKILRRAKKEKKKKNKEKCEKVRTSTRRPALSRVHIHAIKMSDVPRKYKSLKKKKKKKMCSPFHDDLFPRGPTFSRMRSPRDNTRNYSNATEFRRTSRRGDPICIIAGGLSARIIYVDRHDGTPRPSPLLARIKVRRRRLRRFPQL